jgi:hypothetical protein
LKPFLTFDLSSASLLYVLLRMPLNLKDKLPREKIELAVTNWFKEKTSFNSIYITEPIYTEDMSDRIDVVMFIGGFETNKMKADLGTKVKRLKDQAVEKGLMREDWKVLVKTEVEPKKEEIPTQNLELPRGIEKPKKTHEIPAEIASIVEDLKSVDSSMNAVEPKIIETPTIADIPEKVENPIPVVKPKRARRTKKTENKKNLDE